MTLTSHERLTERCGLTITSLKEITHLDGAALSPLPDVSLAKIEAYYQIFRENGFSRVAVQQVFTSLNIVRGEIQKLLGAKSIDEIILTRSATEAINIVANGIQWHSGDEILISDQEHISNILPWLHIAQQFGCYVRTFHSQPGQQFDLNTIEDAVSNKTRLVAFTHVSNIYGTIQPVEQIVQFLKHQGIYTFVDAAQSVGRIAFSVIDIGCDFMAGTGRKALLGPLGSGFLYVASSVSTELTPWSCSRHSVDIDIDEFEITYKSLPGRLEGILPSPGDLLGLGESIRQLNILGIDKVQSHIRYLTAVLFEILSTHPDLQIIASEETTSQAGLISWIIKDISPNWIADYLANQGVYISYGNCGCPFLKQHIGQSGVCRISISAYNNLLDITNFQTALETMNTQ